MQTITVNNHSFDFDIMDVETAERYEAAMQTVSDRVTALQAHKGLKNSESMRAQCDIVRDMVSSVLGAEAAEQLLSSDKPNLRESFAVFQAVFDAVEAQSKEASLGFKRVADSIAAHKKA